MPLCGGGKTVHRKLVLLYRPTTFHYCQLTYKNLKQRRRCLRQDVTAQRLYQRVGLYLLEPSGAYLMRLAPSQVLSYGIRAHRL